MNSKEYRTQLAQTTDDFLRYEFLRLIAQEGREHFMRQIAKNKSEVAVSNYKASNVLPASRAPVGGSHRSTKGILPE
jgi:hypothetical protein